MSESSDRIRAELDWWIGGLREYFSECLASPTILGTVTIRERLDTIRGEVRGLFRKENEIREALDQTGMTAEIEPIEDLYIDLSVKLDDLARYLIALSIAIDLGIYKRPQKKGGVNNGDVRGD